LLLRLIASRIARLVRHSPLVFVNSSRIAVSAVSLLAARRVVFSSAQTPSTKARAWSYAPRISTLEAANGIDPWFEWMKHLQQYPEADQPHPQLGFENWYLLGSFIMDWTRDQNVALYFANGSTRSGDGALWVVDASATGKTLHRDRSVRSILDQMKTASQRGESLGIPLMFHPRRQISYLRAERQSAVYIAQMELVYDFAEVWDSNQRQPGSEQIILKLVLPAGTQGDCERYLTERGVTEEYLFPA
jgi:hypothetical protein